MSAPAFPNDLLAAAADILEHYRRHGLMLATAESCTGGLIAGCLTEISGSSDVVDRGFVTYSNGAKATMLGVSPDLIAAKGAVSAEVAMAMAEGALARSDADVAVSVTGVAGPGGGTAEKPVGLVHLACAKRGEETRLRELRLGERSRSEIRIETVREAFALLRARAR